jgi:hypothetical protein
MPDKRSPVQHALVLRRIEPDHGVAILLALIERDRDRVVRHGLV